MGRGEDAYNRFYKWFSVLVAAEQARCREANPEPEDWKGFYDAIVSHPWIVKE